MVAQAVSAWQALFLAHLLIMLVVVEVLEHLLQRAFQQAVLAVAAIAVGMETLLPQMALQIQAAAVVEVHI
jgi:hypothetical protein